MKTIPLCDLKIQYQFLREEILSTIDKICSEASFIKGPYVKKFEQEFKQAHNAHHGVGCSNGTSALSLALEALDIGKGDEVLLPSHTFMATAEAICHVGATPVFVDIKPDDYTINSKEIEKKISPKTKAIIPVHIYGTPCDMEPILKLAKNYQLKIIEDCAQAHFAQYKGQFVGTFGDAATFSFYPGKNLGAYGDAGFVLCKEQETEEKLKRLIDHGRLDKFDHSIIGYNHRLDAIQAAILSIKLKHIHRWTKKRQEIAKNYDSLLKPVGLKTIEYDTIKSPVYHVYTIEVAHREQLQQQLSEYGIQTGIHYPSPTHKMPAFSHFPKVHLGVTEAIIPRILSLPIYPELETEQQHFIAHHLIAFIEKTTTVPALL